ncbi:NADH:flavin oxidoreductase [Holdemanella porci]|jgi:NAD(H)-dependent 7beta-hydroxy-3-oxo-delta4-cholenoic acid oxidoreductase|uniref:NADH:flavin oxidoreductase n=1 Tax=Holdemanella porci TaxID=2652276 RepID=UPI0022E2D4F0|nr:FAD-dependent oxidoreductase [Holdemanella porci]
MTTLFDELQIGSMILKNRTFMAPMSLGYGDQTGIPTLQEQAYWLERAKGEVGCIITDATSVDPNTPYLGNTLCFRSEESIVEYKKFTDKIHEYGTKIIPQITHPGPESISSFFGVTPISSSGYLNSMYQKTRELKVEEIPNIISMYANTSYQAKQAGFDGIELHCAHGYMLLGSFLSPLKNKRTDEYGGDLMHRARLLFEVIEAIKSKCGAEFPIILRMSGSEKIAGGNTVENMLQLIPELEKRGVDAFEISGGSQYELPNKIMPSHGEECATNLKEALRIKEISHIPVLLVGKINEAKLARSLVEEEKVDGIVLGRALLADADFVKKVKEGKDCQIAPCTGCLAGCVGQQTKRLCGTCVINPFCGHEIEMKIEPSTSNKKIMVIGGGIGGLSAARMCALRGLDVEIFEKSNVLGGQINLASKIAPKKEMHKWIEYLENECQRLHIPVHLNHEVKVDDVNSFDVVLVCNGSIPKKPNENAYTAHDILGDKVDVHGNVLVVGGGMVGVEASEYICEKHPDAHVTILEMKKNIDDGESPANLVSTMTRIQTLPITALTETKLVSVEDGVVVEKAGETQNLGKFDFIIYATGSKPDSSLYEAIREIGKETYLFGDASSVAQALEAVRDGVNIALKL